MLQSILQWFTKPACTRGTRRGLNRSRVSSGIQCLEVRELLSATLVRDINTNSNLSHSRISAGVNVGGILYFTAADATHGEELWRTDGTTAGTWMVRDIRPGSDHSEIEYLTNVSGTLFFTAVSEDGLALWTSDGTEAGTLMVQDLSPSGDGNAEAWYLTSIGNAVYFASAPDGVHFSLWRSDGTQAGTQVILAAPADQGFYISELTAVADKLYFVTEADFDGTMLWVSNGTESGTVPLNAPGVGASLNYPHLLQNHNGVLYFAASDAAYGRELWKSDGTVNGTVMAVDLSPGPGNSTLRQMASTGSHLYVAATTSTAARGLFETDGTAAGTQLLRDFSAGGRVDRLTNANGTLYFRGDDGVSGSELWKSNGTSGGTVLVRDIVSGGGGSSVRNIIWIGNRLYFEADTPEAGTELWKSDGTENGTQLVRDVVPGPGDSLVSEVSEFQGRLYYYGLDSVAGAALWRSDGTESGTQMFLDSQAGTHSSDPRFFAEADGTLFFGANDGVHGQQLWASDGSTGGTVLLQDSTGGLQLNPAYPVNLNGTLYFRGGDFQIWKSDGTAAGTTRVTNLTGGPFGPFIEKLFVFGNQILFTAHSATGERELWATDGTPAGTIQLTDLPTDDFSGALDDQFVTFGGLVYFAARTDSSGGGLWRTDGTPAGTTLVRNFASGFPWTNLPHELTVAGGSLFFTVYEPDGGMELWKSDGSEAGTVLVRDLLPGTDSSYPSDLTESNGSLYFVAADGSGRTGLWKSNGSAQGTELLRSFTGYPRSLVNSGGTLYFQGDDADSGAELWKSDGTAGGTVLVKDIRQGGHGSFPSQWITVDGTLYFTAGSETSGNELWKTDGTGAGTQMVMDLAPGTGSSLIGELTQVGRYLMFSATDNEHGSELWKFRVNRPPVSLSLNQQAVSENTSPPSIVGLLSTVDPDPDDTFVYELAAGSGDSGNSRFQILGNQLIASEAFDFESNPSWSVRIRSTDIAGSFTEQVFQVSVLNSNEPPGAPVLSSAGILENVAIGSVAGTFSAVDPDTADTLTYTLVSGVGDSGNSAFVLDGSSLKTTTSLNYEVQSSYSIRVRVTDSGSLFSEQVFTVSVTDQGETPTGISLSAASVPENSAVNTLVGTLSSVDQDSGSTFIYSLVSGTGDTDNGQFQISGSTLRTAAVFDHESRAAYSVRIRTTDSTGLTYDQSFTIQVSDVPETPVNLGLNGASLLEDDPIGTVAGTFVAEDPDAGETLIYTLVSGTGDSGNSAFVLDGNSLKTVSLLNYEVQSSYSIRVRVTDSAGLFSEQVIAVQVNDQNEAPADLSLSGMTVGENLPARTSVGEFSVTDPDAGQIFTLSLVNGTGSSDNDKFEIVGSTLKTTRILDFEQQSALAIRVRVQDQAGSALEKNFVITVINGNDGPTAIQISPVVTELSDAVSTASGRLMASLSVSDDLMGTNVYSLYGSDASAFEIRDGGLWLKSGVVLDASIQPRLQVSINVTDSAVVGYLPVSAVYSVAILASRPAFNATPAFTSSLRPPLTWQEVRGTVSYEVQIGNLTTGVSAGIGTTTQTRYVPQADLGIGLFSARVRAFDTTGIPGPWSSEVRFRIGTPVVLQPVVRLQNTLQPVVQWNLLPGAARYDVWVDNLTTGQSQAVRASNVVGSHWKSSVPLPVGDYRIWVRGIDAGGVAARWSSSADFKVLGGPSNLTPVGGTFEMAPRFSWSQVPGVALYDVSLWNRSTGRMELTRRGLTTSSYTVDNVLPAGPYRWWVQGITAAGVRTFSSAAADIWVGGRTEFVSPSGTVPSSSAELRWNPVQGAARYELYVTRIGAASPAINLTSLTGTVYLPAPRLTTGSWRAWVRAVSSTGTFSPWSVVREFQVVETTGRTQDAGLSGELTGLLPSIDGLFPQTGNTDTVSKKVGHTSYSQADDGQETAVVGMDGNPVLPSSNKDGFPLKNDASSWEVMQDTVQS